MPETCRNCGQETVHYFIKFANGNSYTECKVCEYPRHSMIGCTNPYDGLVLTHVHDEQGHPLRVTSKRQLLEAEKKYHFRSLVANYMSENFDKPPQDKLANLHPADRIAQQMQEQVGRRDAKGNKLGFLHPEVAAQQLREIKERGIDISEW